MKSMKSFSRQEPESEAVGQLVRAELQQSGVIPTSLPASSQQSCRRKPSLILLVKEMHAVFWSCPVSQTGASWNHLLAVAKLAPASDTSVCQPHGSSNIFKWTSCFQNSCTKGGQCWGVSPQRRGYQSIKCFLQCVPIDLIQNFVKWEALFCDCFQSISQEPAFSKAFQKQLLRGVSAGTPPLYTVALWNICIYNYRYITYDNAIS